MSIYTYVHRHTHIYMYVNRYTHICIRTYILALVLMYFAAKWMHSYSSSTMSYKSGCVVCIGFHISNVYAGQKRLRAVFGT